MDSDPVSTQHGKLDFSASSNIFTLERSKEKSSKHGLLTSVSHSSVQTLLSPLKRRMFSDVFICLLVCQQDDTYMKEQLGLRTRFNNLIIQRC